MFHVEFFNDVLQRYVAEKGQLFAHFVGERNLGAADERRKLSLFCNVPLQNVTESLVIHPLYWSLALGACLGGNGSLVGASANVVIAQIARKNNYTLSFVRFTKTGFPVMVLSLIIATGYVLWRYF